MQLFEENLGDNGFGQPNKVSCEYIPIMQFSFGLVFSNIQIRYVILVDVLKVPSLSKDGRAEVRVHKKKEEATSPGARTTVFLHAFVAPEGRKVRLRQL